MIVGIGIDLVDLARFAASAARHDDALMDRLFTPRERAFAEGRRGSARDAHFAGRFAAKEAAMKALGTGLAQGIRWHDVEVVATAQHAPPSLELHGAAAAALEARGGARTWVSITHSEQAAAAVVILESPG